MQLFGLLTVAVAAVTSQKVFELEALQALLSHAMTSPSCSVAVIADESSKTAHNVIENHSGLIEGGVTVMRANLQKGKNDTQKLTQSMLGIKRLRILNKCFGVVIATDDIDNLRYLLDKTLEDRLVVWSRFLIVLTTVQKDHFIEQFNTHWLYTMMNTVVIFLENDKTASVVRHLPYTPIGAVDVTVATCCTRGRLDVIQEIFGEKFLDFHGAIFNYTALPHLPYWDTYTDSETGEYVHYGTDFVLLDYLSRSMNFTPNYLHSPTWNEVASYVTERKSLLASIYYFVFLNRLKFFDYSYPTYITSLSVILKNPSEAVGWENFLKPYTWQVWMGTILAAALMPIVMMMIFSSIKRIQKDDSRALSLSYASLEILGLLLGQPFMTRVKFSAFRILIAVWLLFEIILTTGYRSNLIASMTLPTPPKKIETVSQLAASGVGLTAQEYGKDYVRFLDNSDNDEYKELASRFTIIDSVKKGLNLAQTGTSGHIDEGGHLSYVVANDYTSADGTAKLYRVKEDISYCYMALPVPFDAPYVDQIDKPLFDLTAAGLYLKWNENELEKIRLSKLRKVKESGGTEKFATDSKIVSLDIGKLLGPFLVLLCGVVLSTLVFIAEFFLPRKPEKDFEK